MTPIRVFVVDDHPMIRHGLQAMMSTEPELLWVGDAGDGADAIRLAPAASPDVVIMDLLMPRMDGVNAIRVLRPLLPQTRFLVLTSLVQATEMRRAMEAGASGYVLKSATPQQLLTNIQLAHRGHRVVAPEVNETQGNGRTESSLGSDLTQRENELLRLMSRGLTNQDISAQLGIAMPTVKFHVTNILAKLHADNRTEAVLVALRHRLVSLD